MVRVHLTYGLSSGLGNETADCRPAHRDFPKGTTAGPPLNGDQGQLLVLGEGNKQIAIFACGQWESAEIIEG